MTPDEDPLQEGALICANEAIFSSFAKVVRNG